jgi:hypothetical protein
MTDKLMKKGRYVSLSEQGFICFLVPLIISLLFYFSFNDKGKKVKNINKNTIKRRGNGICVSHFSRPGRLSAAGGRAVGFQPMEVGRWRFRGGFAFQAWPPYPQGWAGIAGICFGYEALGERFFLTVAVGRTTGARWAKYAPLRQCNGGAAGRRL